MIETLLFQTSLELAAIAAICAICGAVLPFPEIRALEPTILVAGTLACGFAFSSQRPKRDRR